MKIRVDFVTNSSSAQYIIRNTSDSTKTMLDLLRETTGNRWRSDEFLYGITTETEDEQMLLEAVAKYYTFEPHSEESMRFTYTGEGGHLCPSPGTGKSKSFEVIGLGP